MFCSQCGQKIKTEANFCHGCGSKVSAAPDDLKKAVPEVGKSWLHSFGAFLFLPVFAGIVVLLFWVNEDPEVVSASSNSQQPDAAMSGAAMQQVHETLSRLKDRVEADPTDLVAIDSLAVMYAIAGSYDKAMVYYEKHLEVDPDNADVKIALALTNSNLQNNDKAIALLQEVLDADQKNAFALHYMLELS